MKISKLLKTFAFTAMACTVISGCGEEENKPIELSVYAAAIAENTPTGVALKAMVKHINENSKGTIHATDYYDSALGDGASMVQGLTQGTIDIGVTGTAYFSGLVPQIEVFQLPFLFNNLEEAREAVDGPAGDAVAKLFESKGIKGLMFWENGFRELSNNVRPVHTPADLAGIKMRTLPSPVQVETWRSLGALPSAIDASELYTALQQGTVSAEENPLHEIVSRKFYEVQKYITLTDHVYTPYFMGMSLKTWTKLNDEQRQVIMEAAEIGKAEQRKQNQIMTEAAMKTILDYGCEVITNPNKQEFSDKTKQVWEIFTKDNGSEILDMIKK